MVIIGISVDEDESMWREFIAREVLDWPQALDRSHALVKAFQIPSPSSFIVLAPDGHVQFREVGWTPMTYFELEREIRKAMQESSPQSSQLEARF